MSLFGGDASIPSERSSSPQDAPDPPLLPFTYVPDPDDSLDEDFRPSSPDVEPAPLDPRIIKPQAWRRYTEADREIAASLENIESADLAAHLYNAHSLKRRLWRPKEQLNSIKDWQSKDVWLKKGDELQYRDPLTGELETELVPSKLWTAWPLPPKRLRPKRSTYDKTEISEDGWYIGSSIDGDSTEVMREEILALFLRTAKKNWTRHQADTEDMKLYAGSVTHSYSSLSRSTSEADVEHGNSSSSKKGNDMKKRIKKQKERSANSPEADGERATRQLDHSNVDTEDDGANETSDGLGIDSEPESTILDQKRRRGSLGAQQSATKAAFLADDDEARRILDPSVNSLLSRIDRLALAVHRNRSNNAGDGPRRSASASDYLTDGDTPAPRVRSLSGSRPRSHMRKAPGSSQHAPAKKRNHRPQRPRQEVDGAAGGESASEYGADHETEDEDAPVRPRSTRTRSKSSNSSHRSNASSNSEVRRGAGLMDWSELLGLAAIAGFDQSAIANTAQRCASLFGEQMSFRTFDESLAAQHVPAPIQYTPTIIPAPDEMHSFPDDVTRETEIFEQDPRSLLKRPYFDVGSLRCPHTDCPGHLKDFSGASRLTEHVRRKHGYDPRTNNENNEERTVGGVHIDGYLQPVWAKAGWLGHGRAKSGATDNGPQTPKRKRQRLIPRPTSTVTSAYTTQEERDDEEGEEHAVATYTSNVSIPAQRSKLKKTCTNCSRRKKACNGDRPCGRCQKLGEAEACQYPALVARLACLRCRRKKQRCDYNEPCGRCQENGEGDSCQYPA